MSSELGGMIQEWRGNMSWDDLRGTAGGDNTGMLIC